MSETSERAHYWNLLEQGPGLEVRLQALGELEMWVEPESQLERDLIRLKRRLEGSVERAVARVLLAVRRKARHREVLTAGSNSRIGEHRINESLQRARETLRSGDAASRIAFLREAIRQEIFEVGPALVANCLREKDEAVLAVLAQAVGVLGSEGSVRMLMRLAEHSSPEVRLGVAEGLAWQCGQQAVQGTLHLVGDRDPGVSRRAQKAIETIPGTEVLLAWEKIPESRHAAIGLGLDAYLSARRASPPVQSVLRALARSSQSDLRERALSLLGASLPPRRD
jgi:hypothetical protein